VHVEQACRNQQHDSRHHGGGDQRHDPLDHHGCARAAIPAGSARTASGITLGLAIGLGGLLATGPEAIADAIGIHTSLEFLPVFSVIALACVASLPHPRG
jgi:hypothetical protein